MDWEQRQTFNGLSKKRLEMVILQKKEKGAVAASTFQS
jgi:hypothetical protein